VSSVIAPSVTAWIAARRNDDDWAGDFEPLAALAVTLAGSIDDGNVTGPMAKELRATLAALAPVEVHADAFDLLAAELSAAMGDAED
jgi:hypothetical protein